MCKSTFKKEARKYTNIYHYHKSSNRGNVITTGIKFYTLHVLNCALNAKATNIHHI